MILKYAMISLILSPILLMTAVAIFSAIVVIKDTAKSDRSY